MPAGVPISNHCNGVRPLAPDGGPETLTMPDSNTISKAGFKDERVLHRNEASLIETKKPPQASLGLVTVSHSTKPDRCDRRQLILVQLVDLQTWHRQLEVLLLMAHLQSLVQLQLQVLQASLQSLALNHQWRLH